jgi:FKBP-type peptidyl-prolyl cis-trans isomerase FkpA
MSVTAVPLRPVKKGSVLKLWLGLAFLCLIAAAAAWAGTRDLLFATTASGLKVRVIEEGEGPTPTEKDVAFVTYTGRLEDGTVFDSNEGQQPAPFPVAEGATIKGFSEGMKMMRKGGRYRLRIPPQLGYGEKGAGDAIPPNATLEFDITMHGFMAEEQLRAIMMQQQMGLGGGAPGGEPAGPPSGGGGEPGGPPQGQ